MSMYEEIHSKSKRIEGLSRFCCHDVVFWVKQSFVVVQQSLNILIIEELPSNDMIANFSHLMKAQTFNWLDRFSRSAIIAIRRGSN